MAAKTNLTTTTEITVNPREIDFVTRFQRNWEHLREIMGIMRPIRMQPGTVLKSKYAQGTLQSGTVAEGEEIPYSQYTVKEKDYGKITIPEVLGVNHWIVIAVFLVLFLALFRWAEKKGL